MENTTTKMADSIIKALVDEYGFDEINTIVLTFRPYSTPLTNRRTYGIDAALPADAVVENDEGVNGDSTLEPYVDKETLDLELDEINREIERYHQNVVIIDKLSKLVEHKLYALDEFLNDRDDID
jgi:hypothetical protein